MAFGTLDTKYIDFPPNVDATYLQGLRTRAGVDFALVLRELDNRMGAANSTQDPLVASTIAVTTEAWADTTLPTAFEVHNRSEYALPRPQLVEGQGVMLPIGGYNASLLFTEDALEFMSMARIMTNVDSAIMSMRGHQRKLVLERLFSDAEVRVDTKTTATSPGFAGSGTGGNVFSGSYPDGTALPGGYTHYYAVGGGTLAATLKSARDRLRRWYSGPFDLIAPQAQIDLIVAINPGDPANGFVSAGSALVRSGTGTAEAQVDPVVYLGVLFGDVRVRMAIVDTADPNIAIYKSFGNLDARNPLAWRYDPLIGRNMVVKYRSLYPLDQGVILQDYGIGVNNRTAAVLIENGAAPYTAPTIIGP